MSKLKKIIYAVATLSGTTVGVGIFSLPYIASRAGLVVTVAYFLILGLVTIAVHLIFGELAVATPDFKRLPGFAQFYLGKWGKRLSFLVAVLGALGALLAYLIVGGEFLTSLFSPFLGGERIFYTLLYFVVGALLIFLGIKIIAQIELISLILFFLVLVIIFFQAQGAIKTENLVLYPAQLNLALLFLPYGAVLFSLWGATLIPEVEEMLKKEKKLLRVIIPVATLIPMIIYLFFIYAVLGICGTGTTESALGGLYDYLGDGIVSLMLLFGVLTTFTSFITLGLTLKRVFWYDLKIGKNWAWVLACFPPLIAFLLGFKSFITVISLSGGILLGLEGILILLMYQKAKRKGWVFALPLILVFVLGLILEIIYFSK